MPEPMDNQPIPNPADQGGGAAPAPVPEPTPQPSHYDSLMTKKGFADNESFAKSYEEAESGLGKAQNKLNSIKQSLEAVGYSYDDNGAIVQTNQPAATQNPYVNPQQGGYQQPNNGQPEGDPIYDPYLGSEITNPIDMQLARMPLSQRHALVTNAILEQREMQQREATKYESEVLGSDGAKGFEADVRGVMNQLPLAQRSKKENWSDALLRVKGMKYDEAIKTAGSQGVDSFLNKLDAQGLPVSGTPAGAGVRLTPDQERDFQWYQTNQPGIFKDKAHFLKRQGNTG